MGGREHAPAALSYTPIASPVIPAQAGTTTHPFPPDPATLTPEQECRIMPLLPQRRPALYVDAGNLSLANGCQNLTEVDTRLTKVDKG